MVNYDRKIQKVPVKRSSSMYILSHNMPPPPRSLLKYRCDMEAGFARSHHFSNPFLFNLSLHMDMDNII